MNKESILKQVSIFNSLSLEEIKDLSNISPVRTYQKDENVVSKEELGSQLFIVSSGRVKVTAEAFGGDEIVLCILYPTDFFGEMAILDGQPRSATIVAMERTELITIEKEIFLGLIKRQPEVAIKILIILSQRLRKADELIEQLRFLNATGRLIRALIKLMDEHGQKTDDGMLIEQRLTHNDLASFSGTSRESVRKIIREFQKKDKQYIRFKNGRITILDEGKLLKELAKCVMQ